MLSNAVSPMSISSNSINAFQQHKTWLSQTDEKFTLPSASKKFETEP